MTREEIEEVFRRNLRELRERAGLSQSELARRAGVSPSYICDLQMGRRAPMITSLAPLAEALGVAPSMLISISLPLSVHKDRSYPRVAS